MITDISTVTSKKQELYDAFLEIFQGRSDFQLQKFVVDVHVSTERQYAQCVLELQNKYYSIKRSDIIRRKLQHEIEKESCTFTVEEKKLELEQIEIAIVGALREFDTLYQIFQQLPKYTNKQLQDAEGEYWLKRLSTQAQQDIEAQGTISVGNAEALRQVGIIREYTERFMKVIEKHPGACEFLKEQKEKQKNFLK